MHSPTHQKIIALVKSWGDPISDRIVVLPEEKEKETDSGLLRANVKIGDDNNQVGEVIKVGPGRVSEYGGQRIEMQTKVGDRVLFSRHAGDTIFVDEDGNIYAGLGDKREEWLCIKILRQDTILLPISNVKS